MSVFNWVLAELFDWILYRLLWKGVSSYKHNDLSEFWVPEQTYHQVAALPVPLEDMIPPNNRLKWQEKTIFLKILAICMVFLGCKKMEKAVK